MHMSIIILSHYNQILSSLILIQTAPTINMRIRRYKVIILGVLYLLFLAEPAWKVFELIWGVGVGVGDISSLIDFLFNVTCPVYS